MSLRIAWACYPTNTGLAIAANIFVYVGTIILYMVDWFFIQRIVRAQHTVLGWSTAYRIFHRAALAGLIITLLMLIVSQVWQYFTLDSKKLHIFHAFFLTGQTYFTVFCLAPAVLVLISLLIPRTEVEKFGAGRLRNNITILLVAVAILSIGQVFRCVLAWIPATPRVDAQRQTIPLPWYLTKACFYCFNFVTEIIVIIMFALVRVDLRFHVPNGSRKSGDYSCSRVNVHKLESEKNVAAPSPMILQNNSSQTLHRYNSSVFEDTQTLADSLRYPSSTLEVDQKTGNWKVKRLSSEMASGRTSVSFADTSRSSPQDRHTHVDNDAPPVPELPTEWPLPDAAPPRGSNGVLVHTNPPSRRGTPQQRTYEIKDHQLNNTNVGDAVTDALTKLEMNSNRNKTRSPPPQYARASVQAYKPTLPAEADTQKPSRSTRKRSTFPPNDTTRTRTNSSTSTASKQPPIAEAPELPATSRPEPTHRTSPSLEIISLLNHMSSDSTRVVDASLQRSDLSTAAGSESGVGASHVQSEALTSGVVTRQASSKYSDAVSEHAKETAEAEREFQRFSYEAPGREGDVLR